jgi:hypothetical protein
MAVTHRSEFVSQNVRTEFLKASDIYCVVYTVLTLPRLFTMYLYNTQCLTLTAGYTQYCFTCPTRPHVPILLGYPQTKRLLHAHYKNYLLQYGCNVSYALNDNTKLNQQNYNAKPVTYCYTVHHTCFLFYSCSFAVNDMILNHMKCHH